MKQKSSTKNSHIENHLSSILLAALILLIALFYITKNNTSDAEGVRRDETLSISALDQVDHYLPPPSDTDHYKVRDARNTITIVNFFSMDCVHCRKAYLFEEKLLAKYGDKVNLVYRHNPLPEIQPLSAEKALLAECVYNQGGDVTMFRFIREAYERFDIVNQDNIWIKDIAKKYVDDKEKLESCMTDPKEKEKISIAKNKAIASDVTKTPTIAIYEGTKLIERNDGMNENNIAKSLEYWLTRPR